MVRALWDHPHREQWGAGFGGQAIHTVLPHPTDPQQVTVAMSTGGVYRTFDGGESWAPANQGIRAIFLPEDAQFPEFGQCVHKVARDPANPDRLYLQNHGGVYRSDDGADSWTSIADGLPSDFGFPVVAHPRKPGTVWVFPLEGADGRFPVDGECSVWRSRDAGEHVGAAAHRAARRVLRRCHARRHVRRRRRPDRRLLRQPRRHGVRQRRRGGHLGAGGRAPARRALRPRGRRLTGRGETGPGAPYAPA